MQRGEHNEWAQQTRGTLRKHRERRGKRRCKNPANRRHEGEPATFVVSLGEDLIPQLSVVRPWRRVAVVKGHLGDWLLRFLQLAEHGLAYDHVARVHVQPMV